MRFLLNALRVAALLDDVSVLVVSDSSAATRAGNQTACCLRDAWAFRGDELRRRVELTVGSVAAQATTLAAVAANITARANGSKEEHFRPGKTWSDGVSRLQSATTRDGLVFDVLSQGNPLVALHCVASADVVLTPLSCKDRSVCSTFTCPPSGDARRPLNESLRCSNFVSLALALSRRASVGVPSGWKLTDRELEHYASKASGA